MVKPNEELMYCFNKGNFKEAGILHKDDRG